MEFQAILMLSLVKTNHSGNINIYSNILYVIYCSCYNRAEDSPCSFSQLLSASHAQGEYTSVLHPVHLMSILCIGKFSCFCLKL